MMKSGDAMTFEERKAIEFQEQYYNTEIEALESI